MSLANTDAKKSATRTRLVEAILTETYGIMVYQEQVMQTAQLLAGYSLGAADSLRRAMGKKKPRRNGTAARSISQRGGQNGIGQAKADEIFDLIERFAGYGFNKSHAAAYSLLAYQTAWLKVHYRAEFFCANLTVEASDTDKIKVLIDDARKMGLQIEPPDINRSQLVFEPVSQHLIRFGLVAIKGVGTMAIDAIIAARQAGGAFTSLFDFYTRIDRSRVNKRAIESLIKAGAFDSLEPNRAAMFASIDQATTSQRPRRKCQSGGVVRPDRQPAQQHSRACSAPCGTMECERTPQPRKIGHRFFPDGSFV